MAVTPWEGRQASATMWAPRDALGAGPAPAHTHGPTDPFCEGLCTGWLPSPAGLIHLSRRLNFRSLCAALQIGHSD